MRALERLRDITPIRIPRSAPGILVFGGAFDPPHRWHTRVASVVRRRVFGHGGWIVFIPSARSPLKRHVPVAAPAERAAMLRLAIRRLRNAVVWTDEIDRASWWRGPSYTVDTLDRLRHALRRDVPVRLLIGSDQAVRFHRWKRGADILVRAMPVVVWRPPVAGPRALRRALGPSARNAEAETRRFEFWRGLVVPAPVSSLSSTRIRSLIARRRSTGRVPATLRRMLDPAVLRHILERGLYARSAARD